jgi:hypothetical protein
LRSLPFVSFLVVAASGCQQAQAPSTQGASSSTAVVAVKPKVARVVFIDKENACDCTKKRIDGTWAALQTALGTTATLLVERIHLDTQASQAEAYTLLKPLMVPPGVYFVDARDSVIEMLQGEVTAEQIGTILKNIQPRQEGGIVGKREK